MALPKFTRVTQELCEASRRRPKLTCDGMPLSVKNVKAKAQYKQWAAGQGE